MLRGDWLSFRGAARRQVYAACVNLAACGEPGIHNHRSGLWIPGPRASSRPGMTERICWKSQLEQRRELLLELGLDRLRRPQDRARLQEVERAEGADLRSHDEVGCAV